MKSYPLSSILRHHYLLAIVAGLLFAAALPELGLAGLAWVVPAALLAAAGETTGWERFRVGYVAGFAGQLVTLYWLLLIPYRWHGIPLGPGLGWISLSAFLALYPAAWVWFVSGMTPRNSNGSFASGGVHGEGTWLRRSLWALGGAAAWVTMEMLQARFLTGFPWNFLGITQFQILPLIQIASVTGVYGVSFLVVWLSLSLFSAARILLWQPTAARSAWVAEIGLPLLVVALAFNIGLSRLRDPQPAGRSLRVAFIQPSIPQTLIWEPGNNAARFGELIKWSERALTNQTDLLLWPEAAVPSFARWDTNIFPVITNLVSRHRVWLILGSDDIGRPREPAGPDDYEYYNAGFLVSPEGEFVARYKKRNLVVFGEYIPLARWLPFLKWFTPIQGGFTPGEASVAFELPGKRVKTSLLICFEDTFPKLARDGTEADTDFLVNITNNGWFGEGAAQWQHAAAAVFRTVENDVPLLRCSNNGLTGWVDARGRIRQVFRDPRGTIYGPGYLMAEIPLRDPGESRTATFYHRHGDWFGWGCVALTACQLLLRGLSLRRRA